MIRRTPRVTRTYTFLPCTTLLRSDREPLVHGPADEAFFGVQIEDVEAVDPRREDQERCRQHVRRGRLILDELVEPRFVDHLARRSEEHTSELQTLMRNTSAVFCWKKKKTLMKCQTRHSNIKI